MKALHLLCLVPASLLGALASAQTVVGWNFGTGTAALVASSGTPVDHLTIGSITSFTGQTLTTNTTSPSSGYAGASGAFSGTFSTVPGPFNVATSTAFAVTLTPAEGYQIELTGISWGSRSTSTGPGMVAVRTSADGFAADAFSTGVATNGTWALIDSGSLTNVIGTSASPLTVRIYGYDGTSASAGNWRFDDLSMDLAVSAVPEPSTYATAAGALALLGAVWRRHRRRGLGPRID